MLIQPIQLESVESNTLKWLESDNIYCVGFNTSILECKWYYVTEPCPGIRTTPSTSFSLSKGIIDPRQPQKTMCLLLVDTHAQSGMVQVYSLF
jgi:hypothetical protein